MIELLERRLPMDKRKILAIVFEVAAYAIAAVGIRHPEKRVVTLMRRQAAGNFLVTFEAFERRARWFRIGGRCCTALSR